MSPRTPTRPSATPASATPRARVNPARDDAAEVKALRAVELRLAGASFEQIAKALEYADKSGAKRAYDRGLQSLRDDLAPNVATYRAEQLLRTERLLLGLWPKATNPEGVDHLRAVEQVRRILERQARLLGLDAPVTFQVSDEVDAQIEALLAEMATNDPPAEVPRET
jgi:hypothetical protein